MLFKKVCLFVMVCTVSTILAVSVATANIITFTDEATFDAAISSPAYLDVTGMATSGGYTFVASPWVKDGFTVAAAGGVYFVNDSWEVEGTGLEVLACDGTATVTLPNASTAMGMNLYRFSQPNPADGGYTIHFSDGSEINGTISSFDTVAFVGFASTDPDLTITSATVSAVVPYLVGSRAVTVGTYAVPEPGTLTLLGAGLIGLLCYAWRKRK